VPPLKVAKRAVDLVEVGDESAAAEAKNPDRGLSIGQPRLGHFETGRPQARRR
jgi:hypothetical protein